MEQIVLGILIGFAIFYLGIVIVGAFMEEKKAEDIAWKQKFQDYERERDKEKLRKYEEKYGDLDDDDWHA